jgi:nucleoside transporter
MKTRLIIMNFLQFFIWGSWMMTLGHYGFDEMEWNGAQFGLVFSTMGFASLIMPTLFGILADKWNAKYVYAICHLLFACTMCFLPFIAHAMPFFWVLLIAMCFYMPTIGLDNSIGFSLLEEKGLDPVKSFPPIRVFGTVGFIAAMWLTNCFTKTWGLAKIINPPDWLLFMQKTPTGEFLPVYSAKLTFIITAIVALCLSLYALLAIPTPRKTIKTTQKSWIDKLGLRAFALFKQKKMAIFFVFSLLLGAALQLTNSFGDVFLADTSIFPQGSIINNLSTMILSISQISETVFILAIPFFMKKFGIKKVMLFSMFAWVLRFALFGLAGNSFLGLGLVIASCVAYGMAFDFFNISGALFVQQNVETPLQNSAQGVFMLMTNGIGAVAGSLIAGWLIKTFFTVDKIILWSLPNLPNVWFTFAAYALVVAILFMFIFKYKHNPNEKIEIRH